MKTTGNKEHPSAQFRLFSSEDNFPGKGGVINAIEICSRVWDLEYGLQVRLFDQLKTGSLYTYKETRDNDEQLFNLYVTNLPVALITDAVIIDTGNIFSPIDLFLTGSGSFMTADIYAPELRMLQIQFNEQWISKNYPEHQYESISEVLSATIVPSIKTKETGTDIFNAIGARNDDDLIFRFQHNILTLISSVVKEICPLDTEEINNRSPLIEALIQITKDNIFGSLPPIKDIAAKLTTSDSSLQRHFKDIFQKAFMNITWT